jgi:hypothetical protein
MQGQPASPSIEMTENVDQSGLRKQNAPANASIFKFPAGTAMFLLVCSILCFCLLMFLLYKQVSHPVPGSIGIAAVGAAMLAAAGFFTFRSSCRFRDTIAVNADGIWYLSRSGESTYIAWSEVASVNVLDTRQRLLICDASGSRKIRLEYQLQDFANLRDFVLSHATALTKPHGPSSNIFHRTWINKIILLIFAGLSLLLAGLVVGQPKPFIICIGCAGLFVAALAQDPTTLQITKGALVITYPGWKQNIDLRTITGISLTDIADAKGNVWAAVIINRQNRKPVKLFRFREGSVALRDALQSAWKAAGGSDQLANS